MNHGEVRSFRNLQDRITQHVGGHGLLGHRLQTISWDLGWPFGGDERSNSRNHGHPQFHGPSYPPTFVSSSGARHAARVAGILAHETRVTDSDTESLSEAFVDVIHFWRFQCPCRCHPDESQPKVPVDDAFVLRRRCNLQVLKKISQALAKPGAPHMETLLLS